MREIFGRSFSRNSESHQLPIQSRETQRSRSITRYPPPGRVPERSAVDDVIAGVASTEQSAGARQVKWRDR